MIQRYKTWYDGLTDRHKLAISFGLNWIYWFFTGLIAERYLFDEQRSLGYHLFGATWMAFIMTIPFNWLKVKALFRKERQAKNT